MSSALREDLSIFYIVDSDIWAAQKNSVVLTW
jgi:hypothetical protein